MVSSQQENVVRILNLVSQQHANGLNALLSPVNEVSY
jgi:hypothetical protein